MSAFLTERDLLDACLKHNRKAQRALYDQYVKAMFNTVYRYTCNYHDTQDVLQEGFSRVFRYLKNFDSEKGNLLSWMRKIHIRCALDFLKQKELNLMGNVEEISFLMPSDPDILDKLDAASILTFIEELDSKDRVIFNLFHIEGYRHEEIAEMLSININSSRVYLSRARKKLQERIMKYHQHLALEP